MIVGSVLLILVAVVLLVLGLVDGSSAPLISSIAVSLLAAVALVVGARQAAAARADDELDREFDGDATESYAYARSAGGRSAGAGRPAELGRESAEPLGRTGDSAVALAEPPTAIVPAQTTDPYGSGPRYGPDPVGAELGPQWAEPEAPADADDEYDDEDPPDEPAPQAVSAADAAKVARLTTEVLVIDGRPRYHLPGCVHLLGRESEPLPVGEAVELGFTPCSLCEPDNALLAESRR